MYLTKQEKKQLLCEVKEMNQNTPNGQIRDADTILADLVEKCDFEITGLADNLFQIWEISTDKRSIEDMFYLFTDTSFTDYLLNCKDVLSNQNEFTRFEERD